MHVRNVRSNYNLLFCLFCYELGIKLTFFKISNWLFFSIPIFALMAVILVEVTNQCACGGPVFAFVAAILA